jgi:cytoskeletal protein CcmA (bactofilin family)
MTIGLSTNKRATQMTKQGSPVAPGQINMIGEGTLLEGTLRAEGDVRISGRVVGKLDVAGKVIVAQEGAIDGELQAESADIAGAVDGQVKVTERVILKNTARVDGDIFAGRLVVEEGARFAGKCLMDTPTGVKTIGGPVVENGATALAK